MKKQHFKKIGMIAVALLLIQFTFAQKERKLPPYYIFNDLEALLSNGIDSIIDIAKKRSLTTEELNQLITYTNTAENRLNGTWASIYMGYLKRVEAATLFKTALAFSIQPNFSYDKKLLKDALYYVSNGFKYLNELNPSIYPPYVILDQNTTYNEERTERKTSIKTLKLIVNTEQPTKLLATINDRLGNNEEALKSYYKMFNYNYNLETKTEGFRYYYTAAVRINELSTQYQRYDQAFLDFCTGILYAIENKKINNESMVEILQLRDLCYQALNGFVNNPGAGTKYKFYFPRDFKGQTYEWWIPYIYQMDLKDKWVSAKDDLNGFKYPERSYNDFIRYCFVLLDEKKISGDLGTTVNSFLQKHFKDVMITAKVWFHDSYLSDCEKVKWIAERMERFPVDEKDVKWINKKLKKCEKENKGLKGNWDD